MDLENFSLYDFLVYMVMLWLPLFLCGGASSGNVLVAHQGTLT